MGPENILFADICLAFAKFLVVAGGGVILGVIYGFLGAFITKYTINARIIEPTFVFTICFMAYLTAECFGLSAIMLGLLCESVPCGMYRLIMHMFDILRGKSGLTKDRMFR